MMDSYQLEKMVAISPAARPGRLSRNSLKKIFLPDCNSRILVRAPVILPKSGIFRFTDLSSANNLLHGRYSSLVVLIIPVAPVITPVVPA
jgi:hypothetical protein